MKAAPSFARASYTVALLGGALGCSAQTGTPLPVLRAAVAPAAPPEYVPCIHVETAKERALNRFSPWLALGAGIDRLETGTVDSLYRPDVLAPVLSAGWGSVSYRLNTELHVEAWHWNPSGTWSDSRGRGYFTGSPTPTTPITHSFGYPLPRRGYTRNEGTEAIGYSRLTDGDPKSIWKSNPYLSPSFTGESDAQFPQWVLVDLGKPEPVNALRIAWAEPYAKTYRIEYFDGPDPLHRPGRGSWLLFPNGTIRGGHGGSVTHVLAPAPISARYVRVMMSESSETCALGDERDRRNCVGYAISELFLGRIVGKGKFEDLLKHAPDQSQSATECSSVDPWHTPEDLDSRAGDQTGLDLFFTSGVTRSLPAMIPVSVLYGVPEDSAAEIAYLEKRGYPISYVELGEEPDGQYMTPEHYAALYVQWAKALHAVDPKLKLGGPAFTSFNEDIEAWPDAAGERSWFKRFLGYLRAHARLDELSFMSFEHYPYDSCKVTWVGLFDEPRIISHVLQAFRKDGLPERVPMFVTELNVATQVDQSFVDGFGGLWLADYTGAFLAAGGQGSYFFHYLPFPLTRDCNDTFGTYGMFAMNGARKLTSPTAQYFAAQLLTQEWAEPGERENSVFPASSELVDSEGRIVVTAYALARPDGQWSLLLINKDRGAARKIRVAFRDSVVARNQAFTGTVTALSIGADNYRWLPNGADGHADPAGPIAVREIAGSAETIFTLPRASITVLRGRIH